MGHRSTCPFMGSTELHRQLGIFLEISCVSPVENSYYSGTSIFRLNNRRFGSTFFILPHGTHITVEATEKYSEIQIQIVMHRLNNRPRKFLGYLTTTEIFFGESDVALTS